MDSFGEYLREQRENKGLPLRKVAAESLPLFWKELWRY